MRNTIIRYEMIYREFGGISKTKTHKIDCQETWWYAWCEIRQNHKNDILNELDSPLRGYDFLKGFIKI